MGADLTDAGGIGEAGTLRDIADHPDLEMAQLEDLAQLLPSAQVLALAQSYYASASDMLAQLDDAAAALNWTELYELAHDLKGTSGSFGACRLQYLAEVLERCCTEQMGEAVPVVLVAMRRSLAAAWAAMEDCIPTLGRKSA